MPERSALFQGVQIGPETTLGTGVAASKKLNYLDIELGPELAISRFRPMGQAVPSALVLSQDSSVASVSGLGSYSELIYPFNSMFGNVTPTTVDTTAKQWDWTITGLAEITPKSYTVEKGGPVRAHESVGCIFNGMEITFTRTESPAISGSVIGQLMTDNITMTPGPTSVEDVPIQTTHCNVYVDATSAGLGTTKMTRDFQAVWRNNDVFGPVWVINTANPSWVAPIGTEPTVQVELTLSADAQGMAYLTDLRAGNATKFIRLEAVHTLLAGAATELYRFRIDFAGKISSGGNFEDQDGNYVVNWTLDAVYDTTFAAYQKVRLTNKTAAL